MVAPGPGRAVGRGPCWPLQCLMCRWSALSSAGLEPAVSASASALPPAGAAASGSRGHTQYHCGFLLALKAGHYSFQDLIIS